jgi:hypothetical protein
MSLVFPNGKIDKDALRTLPPGILNTVLRLSLDQTLNPLPPRRIIIEGLDLDGV